MNKHPVDTRSIEQAIRSLPIPAVDLHDRLMHTISSAPRSLAVARRTSRSRLAIYAAALAVLLIGSGFAGISWLQLQHQQAGHNWTIRSFNADNPPPVALESAWKQEAWNKLQPGEAWSAPDPDNPDKGSVLLVKPYVFGDWQALRAALNNPAALPEALPAAFVLHQAEVYDNLVVSPDVVPGEAERVIPRQAGADWSALSLTLEYEQLTYSVAISRGVFKDTIYTHMAGNYRLLEIAGNEAAIIRDDQDVTLYWKNHADLPWTFILSAPLAATDEQMLALLAALNRD